MLVLFLAFVHEAMFTNARYIIKCWPKLSLDIFVKPSFFYGALLANAGYVNKCWYKLVLPSNLPVFSSIPFLFSPKLFYFCKSPPPPWVQMVIL